MLSLGQIFTALLDNLLLPCLNLPLEVPTSIVNRTLLYETLSIFFKCLKKFILKDNGQEYQFLNYNFK